MDVTTEEIEKILDDFDKSLSGYLDSSLITRINTSSAGVIVYEDLDHYFNRCYKVSRRIHRLTDGAFDPTIHPLWTVWDFNEGGKVPDSSVVDSLMRFIGFGEGVHFTFSEEQDTLEQYRLQKHTSGASLGFDGIAQGLAVDILAEMLESKGAKNYYVEIGGEIKVKGVNNQGEEWRIGIDKPIDGSDQSDRQIQEIVQIGDRAIATSGSYRKYFIEDGVKYSHTIDPRTGYPVKHTLLSASVVAETCAMADGLATAFMVMGAEKAMDFVNDHPELNLDVYLIFENDKGRLETFYSKNFRHLFADKGE